MKQLALGFLAAAMSLPAIAAEQNVNYTIRQVVTAKNIVMVQQSSGTPPTVGDLFIVHLNDGKQCTLKVKSLKGTLITMNSADCPNNELSTKLKVEPSLADDDSSDSSAAPAAASADQNSTPDQNDNGWGGFRWAGKIYYAGNATMTHKDLWSPTLGMVDSEIETSGALGIAVSYSQSRPHSWGFAVNAGYETAREMKKQKITSGNTTTTNTLTDAPKLSLFYVDGEMQYRWQDFYLPFGVSLTSVGVTEQASSSKTNTKGGFGVLLGMGYFLTPQLSAEILVRSTSMSMESTTNAGVKSDYGYGTFSSASIGLKYYF
jgi:hypothetical protein